jgi:hypothetical protein
MLLVLAFAHLFFPKRFNWKEELGRLSLLNRQMFLVHVFFIVLLLTLLGVLSLVFTQTLLQPTPLGKVILSGIVLFWSLRLVTQLFVYDSRLWRGNHFNTVVHILFSCMWAYYIIVFGVALWRQFTGG